MHRHTNVFCQGTKILICLITIFIDQAGKKRVLNSPYPKIQMNDLKRDGKLYIMDS